MTLKQRISLWLREVGGPHCDDCIAKDLKLSRRQANRVTSTLAATGNFSRGRGVCSTCGGEKKVIEEI